MASKTPDTRQSENLGSLKLLMALFDPTSLDDGDTWTSGNKGIVKTWFSSNIASILDGQMGTSFTAAGTITFTTADNGQTGTLFVLYKG